MDIKDAVEEYFSALNAMFAGDAEPIMHIWSHTESAAYVGPDGTYLKGWGAVENLLEEHAAMKFCGHVEASDFHYIEGADLAVVYNNVKGHHHVGGKQQPVDIRASQVFRKEGGEWKVVSIQADILPFIFPLAE